jgi:pimeloyl-ACP methyl ester carboxylesterase
MGPAVGTAASQSAHRRTADPGTIVFSHANGFPAGTYRVMFEAWRAAGWKVLAHDQFGHDPLYPVTSNWPRLRDELLAFIDAQLGGGGPAVLVGHSMGGYLSLLAASRRPEIARAVVLLDAPIVAGWRAQTVRALKLSGLMKRGGPGRVSARRRERWPSREEAHAHFAAKRAFARWDSRVLEDYIACGLEPDLDPDPQAAAAGDSSAVRLAFRREVETRIYNTLPHHLGSLLARHPLRCPLAYVGGTRSPEGRQAGMAATRALAGGRERTLEGGHFFPMERPEAAAKAVLALLAEMR